MPPELGGKWETKFLNTRFHVPILQCAGYSVKLKYNLNMIYVPLPFVALLWAGFPLEKLKYLIFSFTSL